MAFATQPVARQTMLTAVARDAQIGADGYNSPVKAYSKIDTFGRAYDTHGVVASLQLAPGASYDGTHTAWQRFLPEGPIAFLPVSAISAPCSTYLPYRR